MKLDCIVTAVNENPLYLEFIPIFVKTWKKLYPDVDVKIILIAHAIPKEYEEYNSRVTPITAGLSKEIEILDSLECSSGVCPVK